jgi:hypothetical protein
LSEFFRPERQGAYGYAASTVLVQLCARFSTEGWSQTPIARGLPDEVRVIRDRVYTTHDARELLLDLYVPAGGGG